MHFQVSIMAKVRKSTQQAYADWLQKFKFTHFVTLTTPYTLTTNSARRLVQRWFDKLQKHGYQPTIFWVAEKFECKDGYHIHLLLKVNKKVLPHHEFVFLCELYQICAGTSKYKNVDGKYTRQWSRIDIKAFNPKMDAGGYVTKYVTKENANKFAEYDILI